MNHTHRTLVVTYVSIDVSIKAIPCWVDVAWFDGELLSRACFEGGLLLSGMY